MNARSLNPYDLKPGDAVRVKGAATSYAGLTGRVLEVRNGMAARVAFDHAGGSAPLALECLVPADLPQTYTDPEGRRWWVDCPACGPQAPKLHQVTTARGYVLTVPHQATPGKLYSCARCECQARVRLIRHAGESSTPTRCNSACLNGKRSCDCRCNGRCHGAGVCRCAA